MSAYDRDLIGYADKPPIHAGPAGHGSPSIS